MVRDLGFLVTGNLTEVARLRLHYVREANEMLIPEARNYLGRDCTITFRDRHGELHTRTTRVHDVTFVPMYGACLVGDSDDIWLDRVTSISALN